MTRRDALHIAGKVFLVVVWSAVSTLVISAIAVAAGGWHG